MKSCTDPISLAWIVIPERRTAKVRWIVQALAHDTLRKIGEAHAYNTDPVMYAEFVVIY